MLVCKPEDSKHRNIYVDITHDCNLNCTFCYDKVNRGKPGISLETFEDVCEKLTHSNPKRKWIRLMGGDPTVSDRFFDFIKISKKYKHIVSISTNGLKIADLDFAKRLKEHAPLYIHINVDGGISHDSIYGFINGRTDLWPIKKQAFDNLKAVKFKHVHIGSIILRNHENVVHEMITIAKRYDNIRGLHFRSLMDVNEKLDTLRIDEIKELIEPYFDFKSMLVDGVTGPQGEQCCGGCYQYNGILKGTNRMFKLVLIEFGSKNNTINCWWRGRLLNDGTIVPWFESMRS